jgi:predicted Mrr-cat superfamily restriction endonuclease
MSYWKIVAGHKYRAPDEVKSVTLGDWLRKNYIAIGWGEGNPQHKVFKNDMKIGDKVIVVTDGFIWAIGEITSDFKQVSLPEGSNLYENKRDVVWHKVTKRSYRELPLSLKNKLKANRAINKLNAKQWESLVLALS